MALAKVQFGGTDATTHRPFEIPMDESLDTVLQGTLSPGQFLLLAAIILGGALTNALVQLKNARDTGAPFDWIDFCIAMGIAGFSGTMFGLGAAYFSDDPLVQHGVSGAGAFLGLSGLNKVTDALLEIIAVKAGTKFKDQQGGGT